MNRRETIALLGGAAAWPVAARAQVRATPVVGILRLASPDASEPLLSAFRRGLGETGYVEGRNVAFEYRFAGDQDDQLPSLAADLVRRPVAVISAGPHTAAIAAQAATATIPIVFEAGTDPVKLGLVASFNRPGGNVTGAYSAGSDLGSKRLDLLNKLVPTARTIAVLMNPNRDSSEQQIKDIQTAADALGLHISTLHASTPGALDAAFATAAERGADGFIVGQDAFFGNRAKQLVALAARYKIPTVYANSGAVDEGGLISYALSYSEAARQSGVYVGRILNGERPAELPVVQSSKSEFLINLKTARALGLTVPPTLLAIADEVIE